MYPLLKQEGWTVIRYVCIYCCIRINTVRYMVINFRGDQIFMDFVRFLIHEVLYAWCLKSIIFTVPGFLSTCSSSFILSTYYVSENEQIY